MSTADELLNQIPAKSVGHILDKLLECRRNLKAGKTASVPYTTLYLHNGLIMQGWLLDIQEDQGVSWVLLQISDDPTRAPVSVGYVAVSSIIAITLYHVTDILQSLSFGAIELPVAEAIPTRIALRQQASDLAQSLSLNQITIDFESFPDNELYRYRVFQMLENLGSVVRELQKSNLAREALSEQVESITLAYGEVNEVSLSNQSLLIKFDNLLSERELINQITTTLK
ncbi:hypothetical protein [Floridanema evergladense]|uniref:Uncharacterized protein n=1 Tax=Floridaenema evergladense BLCC-F167 TaxID=3153639 RepID=A0ABV4WRN1_9CYAN